MAWDDTYTELDAEAVAIAIDKNSREQTLLLFAVVGGELGLYTSTTEGRTLTLADTIATGTLKSPAISIPRAGLRYLYWLDGTTVKGQIRDASNSIRRATFDAILGVDADGSIAVDSSVLQGGALRLVLQAIVDGDLVQYTSPDGVAWA